MSSTPKKMRLYRERGRLDHTLSKRVRGDFYTKKTSDDKFKAGLTRIITSNCRESESTAQTQQRLHRKSCESIIQELTSCLLDVGI